MYNPNYGGFQQGGQMPPGFMQNVPPQQPQTPQQQAQLSQQMMYNAQSFPPQSPYGAPPNGMPPNAMMQNNGMAHMGANMGVSGYPVPYPGTPYGQNPGVPGPQQNFMGGAPPQNAFAMSPQNMTPQPQPQYRMQQRPPSTPTPQGPQRMSPHASAPHGSPPHQQHAQTPQIPNQFVAPRTSTPHQNPPQVASQPQPPQGGQITPQTPNFPPGASTGNSAVAAPLSPGGEIREKERVTLLLGINSLLLMETLRLQAEKESIASEGPDKLGKGNSPPGYVECMRRLQANLSYLAAIADRSHKPASAIPPHPAIMTAPTLSDYTPSKNTSASGSPNTKKDGDSKTDANGVSPLGLAGSHEVPSDRDTLLKEQYAKLQSLFPGVDPKRETPAPAGAANPANRGGPQMPGGGKPGMQQQQQPNVQDGSQNANMNANSALQTQLQQQQLQQQQQQQQQQANAMNMGMGRPPQGAGGMGGMPNTGMNPAAAMMNPGMNNMNMNMQQAMRGMGMNNMNPGQGGMPGSAPNMGAGGNMMPGQMGGMMGGQGMAMQSPGQQMPGQMLR